ncbi:hypothetical protein QGM71_07315 [Virgibacillus sp. C22-A2]|uniref:Tetratricopeptide repeat protein n=1 Tax=Virgibacillus tibetensis TaxID=3042313 RepID=A0ABU6KD88_9BACI|nr:hypothetical protein [Virgibacillus sp. C22-A2]
MSLSKFKKPGNFQAVRKFTDRVEPTKVFNSSVDGLLNESDQFKVLVYYGFGGIGKTKLLNELKELVHRKTSDENIKDVHSVFISLDSFEFNSPTDILLAIRNQLKVPAILFDYALVKYWSAIGKSSIDIKKRLREDSPVWGVLDYGSNLSGGVIPVGLISKSFSSLQDKYYATFSKYKFEIEQINSTDPMKLWEMLPYFLGLAIEDAYEKKGIKHIFYFDAYETMLRKLEDKAISQSPEEWIKELIGASEKGLFLIGSREYIKWGEQNPEWSNYLDQHILGRLSEIDAAYYLNSVPIVEQDIRNGIIKSAKGVPLYLDLCVTIYETKKAKGKKLNAEDFNIAEHEVIERFLRHLSKQEQELVKLLSVMGIFDYDYFKNIIQAFSIGYPTSMFTDFVEKSIVSKIDENVKLYKLDESINTYILKKMDIDVVEEVLDEALEYILKNSRNYSDDVLLKLYGRVCNIQHLIEFPSLSYVEKFVQASFYFIERGNWVDVGNLVQENGTKQKSDKLINASNLIKSVFWRRTKDLDFALEILNSVHMTREYFGEVYTVALFQKANIIRLSGDYNKANDLYNQLLAIIQKKEGNSSFFIKVQRQYADLKFLQGDFQKALKMLQELLKHDVSPIELAETHRIIGHIYRFNWFFKEAENEYKKALEIAKQSNLIGLEGKVYTNLIETLCWQRPKEGLSYLEKATEIHEMLDSTIELGKVYAAAAVCYRKEDQNKSVHYANESIKMQEKVGYKSGVLFGVVAKGILSIREESSHNVEEYQGKIVKMTDELQVYSFLQLPFLIKLNKQVELRDLIQNIKLLEPETTLATIEMFLEGEVVK